MSANWLKFKSTTVLVNGKSAVLSKLTDSYNERDNKHTAVLGNALSMERMTHFTHSPANQREWVSINLRMNCKHTYIPSVISTSLYGLNINLYYYLNGKNVHDARVLNNCRHAYNALCCFITQKSVWNMMVLCLGERGFPQFFVHIY